MIPKVFLLDWIGPSSQKNQGTCWSPQFSDTGRNPRKVTWKICCATGICQFVKMLLLLGPWVPGSLGPVHHHWSYGFCVLTRHHDTFGSLCSALLFNQYPKSAGNDMEVAHDKLWTSMTSLAKWCTHGGLSVTNLLVGICLYLFSVVEKGLHLLMMINRWMFKRIKVLIIGPIDHNLPYDFVCKPLIVKLGCAEDVWTKLIRAWSQVIVDPVGGKHNHLTYPLTFFGKWFFGINQPMDSKGASNVVPIACISETSEMVFPKAIICVAISWWTLGTWSPRILFANKNTQTLMHGWTSRNCVKGRF